MNRTEIDREKGTKIRNRKSYKENRTVKIGRTKRWHQRNIKSKDRKTDKKKETEREIERERERE